MSELKNVLVKVREILSNPDMVSQMFYDFLRGAMSSEEGRKYVAAIILLTIKKHPDVAEHYVKLGELLNEAVRMYGKK